MGKTEPKINRAEIISLFAGLCRGKRPRIKYEEARRFLSAIGCGPAYDFERLIITKDGVIIEDPDYQSPFTEEEQKDLAVIRGAHYPDEAAYHMGIKRGRPRLKELLLQRLPEEYADVLFTILTEYRRRLTRLRHPKRPRQTDYGNLFACLYHCGGIYPDMFDQEGIRILCGWINEDAYPFYGEEYSVRSKQVWAKTQSVIRDPAALKKACKFVNGIIPPEMIEELKTQRAAHRLLHVDRSEYYYGPGDWDE